MKRAKKTRLKGGSETRERILQTADRLFYQEGIRAVGVDRIIAEADVAKMSLYKHFPSKDALILAVLKHREETFFSTIQVSMEKHGKKLRDPLRAFFAALKETVESSGFRGCAFNNAAVELVDPAHPAFEFVREHKQRFLEFLQGLVEQSIGRKGSHVASVVDLLVGGAVVTAVIQGSAAPIEVARQAALKMVAEAKGA